MREMLRRFRLPLLIAGGILFWIESLQELIAPAIGLDASWQQVLGYVREHRFAMGREIVFTYGPWADARLLPMLLTDYRLAGEDNGFLILQRRAVPAQVALETSLAFDARLKQAIAVPEVSAPLWMTIDVRPSWAGRLRAFSYKPAEMRIHLVLASGETKDFRFNPAAASGGFLLTPFLPDTEALKNRFTNQGTPGIRSVTITPVRHSTCFFQQEIKVAFASLPGPPAP